MDAITFFALSAATAATALLVAAAGIGFVLWAAAAVVAKSLRKRGAVRDARLTPGIRCSPRRLHDLKPAGAGRHRHGPLAHGRPT